MNCTKITRLVIAGLALSGASAETLHVPGRYPNIQTAINFAANGDEIVIADGTYIGPSNKNLDTLGLAITIRSSGGAENCTIDCEASGRAFNFFRSEGEPAILDGLTVSNGVGDGGAILSTSKPPTILNCRFVNNRGSQRGGAIYSTDEMVISNSWFSGNGSENAGGGACYGRLLIAACVFESNNANTGGALFLTGGSAVDSVFVGNRAGYGGAIYVGQFSHTTTMNCLLISNEAEYGGAFYDYQADGTLIQNCTIAGNTATMLGSGIGLYSRSATVLNTIVFGNIGDQISTSGNTPSITYCLIQGNWPGYHNIDADPRFVTGPKGDFYLSNKKAGQDETSPCINSGYGNAGDYGLDRFTNRTDNRPDRKVADMGYHYPRR